MLMLMLFIATSLAADMPEFVPPDPTLLAALPADQRETLLSAQIADNSDPQGEERLLMALLVSQRFGEATSADTPELLPTLVDALSEDAAVRGAALARAGTVQVAPTASVAQRGPGERASSGQIQVARAPTTAVLRSASGSKLPQQWRHLTVRHAPPPPREGESYQTWRVEGMRGGTLDALDIARVLQLTEHEAVLTARRRRSITTMGVGIGVGMGAILVGTSIIWFAPGAGLILWMLGSGSAGLGIASPLLWSRHKLHYDRWFERNDLLARIEAHNAYWSTEVPSAVVRPVPPSASPATAAPAPPAPAPVPPESPAPSTAEPAEAAEQPTGPQAPAAPQPR